MPAVRLRVIVPGVLGGLLLLGGAAAAYLRLRTPERAFRDQFDNNIAATAPAVYPAMQADPELRKLLLDKSAAAFARGGWPAATKVFYRIVNARIVAFAGDTTMMGCAAAWRNVYSALQATPKFCRQLEERGRKSLPPGVAAAALAQEDAACNAATEEGGGLRLAPSPPGRMTPDEFSIAYYHALDAPAPLSDAERAALIDPAPPIDAAYCSAVIKHDDNIAALPRAEAARYWRQTYASDDDGSFDYTPPGPQLYPGPPPADFTCAPAGTRFILSMEASADGRPIVWESLGRKGWDCEIHSSVSGTHGMWSTGPNDSDNGLRLLWPLQAGKHAGAYRVAGYGPYWLPWGTVNAFAIEQTYNDALGKPAYTLTIYWAPSLGFEIGRHTDVLHGNWPDDVGPDWQAVAMLPPGAPR